MRTGKTTGNIGTCSGPKVDPILRKTDLSKTIKNK